MVVTTPLAGVIVDAQLVSTLGGEAGGRTGDACTGWLVGAAVQWSSRDSGSRA